MEPILKDNLENNDISQIIPIDHQRIYSRVVSKDLFVLDDFEETFQKQCSKILSQSILWFDKVSSSNLWRELNKTEQGFEINYDLAAQTYPKSVFAMSSLSHGVIVGEENVFASLNEDERESIKSITASEQEGLYFVGRFLFKNTDGAVLVRMFNEDPKSNIDCDSIKYEGNGGMSAFYMNYVVPIAVKHTMDYINSVNKDKSYYPLIYDIFKPSLNKDKMSEFVQNYLRYSISDDREGMLFGHTVPYDEDRLMKLSMGKRIAKILAADYLVSYDDIEIYDFNFMFQQYDYLRIKQPKPSAGRNMFALCALFALGKIQDELDKADVNGNYIDFNEYIKKMGVWNSFMVAFGLETFGGLEGLKEFYPNFDRNVYLNTEEVEVESIDDEVVDILDVDSEAAEEYFQELEKYQNELQLSLELAKDEYETTGVVSEDTMDKVNVAYNNLWNALNEFKRYLYVFRTEIRLFIEKMSIVYVNDLETSYNMVFSFDQNCKIKNYIESIKTEASKETPDWNTMRTDYQQMLPYVDDVFISPIGDDILVGSSISSTQEQEIYDALDEINDALIDADVDTTEIKSRLDNLYTNLDNLYTFISGGPTGKYIQQLSTRTVNILFRPGASPPSDSPLNVYSAEAKMLLNELQKYDPGAIPSVPESSKQIAGSVEPSLVHLFNNWKREYGHFYEPALISNLDVLLKMFQQLIVSYNSYGSYENVPEQSSYEFGFLYRTIESTFYQTLGTYSTTNYSYEYYYFEKTIENLQESLQKAKDELETSGSVSEETKKDISSYSITLISMLIEYEYSLNNIESYAIDYLGAYSNSFSSYDANNNIKDSLNWIGEEYQSENPNRQEMINRFNKMTPYINVILGQQAEVSTLEGATNEQQKELEKNLNELALAIYNGTIPPQYVTFVLDTVNLLLEAIYNSNGGTSVSYVDDFKQYLGLFDIFVAGGMCVYYSNYFAPYFEASNQMRSSVYQGELEGNQPIDIENILEQILKEIPYLEENLKNSITSLTGNLQGIYNSGELSSSYYTFTYTEQNCIEIIMKILSHLFRNKESIVKYVNHLTLNVVPRIDDFKLALEQEEIVSSSSELPENLETAFANLKITLNELAKVNDSFPPQIQALSTILINIPVLGDLLYLLKSIEYVMENDSIDHEALAEYIEEYKAESSIIVASQSNPDDMKSLNKMKLFYITGVAKSLEKNGLCIPAGLEVFQNVYLDMINGVEFDPEYYSEIKPAIDNLLDEIVVKATNLSFEQLGEFFRIMLSAIAKNLVNNIFKDADNNIDKPETWKITFEDDSCDSWDCGDDTDGLA